MAKIEELIDHSNFFLSAETRGTGEEQSIAHGLGSAPVKVDVSITGWDESYYGGSITNASIVQGDHTSTHLKITATRGVMYTVKAWPN